MKCPYCGNECECDEVDIGVGMAQVGPYHCDRCHAFQIDPAEDRSKLSEEEQQTGWHKILKDVRNCSHDEWMSEFSEDER